MFFLYLSYSIFSIHNFYSYLLLLYFLLSPDVPVFSSLTCFSFLTSFTYFSSCRIIRYVRFNFSIPFPFTLLFPFIPPCSPHFRLHTFFSFISFFFHPFTVMSTTSSPLVFPLSLTPLKYELPHVLSFIFTFLFVFSFIYSFFPTSSTRIFLSFTFLCSSVPDSTLFQLHSSLFFSFTLCFMFISSFCSVLSISSHVPSSPLCSASFSFQLFPL